MPKAAQKKTTYQQRERAACTLFGELFTKLAQALVLSTVRLYDVHDKATLGDLSPDFVAFAPDLPGPAPYYVELVGEAKDQPRLASTGLRQLEAYALAVFEKQPLRPLLYAFLATCKEVIFVCFESPADGNLVRPERSRPFLPFRRTPVLAWSHGIRILANLVIMAKKERGTVHEVPRHILPSPTGKVIADGYLGHGRTAVVYRATLRSGDVVAVKQYHSEWKNAMQNEHNCLQKLQATPAAVLKVAAYAPEKHVLLLRPVAVPLSKLRAARQLSMTESCT